MKHKTLQYERHMHFCRWKHSILNKTEHNAVRKRNAKYGDAMSAKLMKMYNSHIRNDVAEHWPACFAGFYEGGCLLSPS